MMESSDINQTVRPALLPHGADLRRYPRISLPAMYTLVRVRPAGSARYCWTGYVYDISQSGMRFELDDQIPNGTYVEVRVMLPGREQTTFTASGQVVRNHEDDDSLGPVRMGMTFDHFPFLGDEGKLESYITEAMARTAAKAA
jgi:hypothetical protein